VALTPKELAQHIGYVMGDFRKRQKLSVMEVSKRSGVSTAYLYDVFSGRTVPTIETLLRVADALGITVDFVIRPEARFTVEVDLAENSSK